MRVLLIASSFPPAPNIGAIRPARIAEYLQSMGHETRVLTTQVATASSRPTKSSLAPESVTRTRWMDLQHLRIEPRGGRRAETGVDEALSLPPPSPQTGQRSSLRMTAGKMVWSLTAVPDNRSGWIPVACRVGGTMIRRDRPDVLLASAPAFSALVVGDYLSRRWGVPWVADYRDLWTASGYFVQGHSRLRRLLDLHWERRVLSSCSHGVTVSAPMAADLRAIAPGLSTSVVMNGIDWREGDREFSEGSPAGPTRLGPATINLLYVGANLYGGKRDPGVVFAAVAASGLGPEDVLFHFLGTDEARVGQLAAEHGVQGHVRFHPPVSHSVVHGWMRSADLLLLLLWDDPADVGTYSGKLFEYLSARRPVLVVGPEGGVAADLVRDRRLGYAATGCRQVAQLLKDLVTRASQEGPPPDTPRERTEGLGRSEQLRLLVEVLEGVVTGRGGEGVRRGPDVTVHADRVYGPAQRGGGMQQGDPGMDTR